MPTIQIKNHTLLRLAAVWPQDDLNLMLSASSSPQPPPVWAGQHGAQMQQPAPVDWIHCIASLSLVPYKHHSQYASSALLLQQKDVYVIWNSHFFS